MFQKKWSLLLFLLPGLILLVLFSVYPFFSGVRYSITDGTRAGLFVGLDNYRTLWQNRMFLTGLQNTVLLSVVGAPLLWLLSFAFALILQAVEPRGTVFRSVSLIPYLAPSSAVLLIWLVLFDFGGPVNRILQMIGVERVLWLDSSALRIPVILMFIWKNLGFCSVIFLASLQSVPSSLYEYAILEGGGFLVLVLCWINAFSIFKEVYIIAGAYPDLSVYTLQHYMNNMFSRFEFQMVTSAAYSFTIIVTALFGVLFLLQRRAIMSAE